MIYNKPMNLNDLGLTVTTENGVTYIENTSTTNAVYLDSNAISLVFKETTALMSLLDTDKPIHPNPIVRAVI